MGVGGWELASEARRGRSGRDGNKSPPGCQWKEPDGMAMLSGGRETRQSSEFGGSSQAPELRDGMG